MTCDPRDAEDIEWTRRDQYIDALIDEDEEADAWFGLRAEMGERAWADHIEEMSR